jgi:hypothetical protein
MTKEQLIDGRDIYAAIPYTGCWEWLLYRDRYGVVRYNGKLQKAHRVIYEILNGKIPDGMCVLHKCDNPGCVNPDHLFLGTQADNVGDMWKKDRHPRDCQAGEKHSFSKLTEEQVLEIRKCYTWGISTISEMAIEHGVSYGQIWNIVRGRQWRHLEKK